MQFTPEQRAVIEHRDQDALIRAVAGSGKTSTLVEFVAARIREGVAPESILTVVFNRAAREDFEQKLQRRLNGTKLPWVRTFNSVGATLLKRMVERGNLPAYDLVTEEASIAQRMRSCLTRAWRDAHGERATPTKEHVEAFRQFRTMVKADVQSPEITWEALAFAPDTRCFVEAFRDLQQEMDRARKMLFDDQIWRPAMALHRDPDLIFSLQKPLSILVVDEYQDTNAACVVLVDSFARLGSHVVACGDEDQAIYGFRGSDVRFISERFMQDYPEARQYTLSRTFRYGHRAALFATALINHAPSAEPKVVVPHASAPDTKLVVHRFNDREPMTLVPLVEEAHRNGTLLDWTVLLRFFASSLLHEIALNVAGIPYHVYGRTNITRVGPVATLVGVLQLAGGRPPVHPEDLRAMFRALLLVPSLFLKREELDACSEAMAESWEAGRFNARTLAGIASTPGRFDASSAKRVARRAEAISLVASGGLSHQDADQVLRVYMGLIDMERELARTAATATDGQEAQVYVDAMVQICTEHPQLATLLDRLDELLLSARKEPPNGPHLAVRSVHSFKGKEAPNVILIGWTGEEFPRAGSDRDEERRLAYVAATRATHELHFLVPDDPALATELREGHSDASMPLASNCSPFLFEGELGATQAIAQALVDGARGEVRVRRHHALQAYLREVGNTHVSVVAARAGTVAAGSGERRNSKVRYSRAAESAVDAPQNDLVHKAAEIGVAAIVHPVQKGRYVRSTVRGTFRVVGEEAGVYRLEPITGRRLISSDLTGAEWSDVTGRYIR